MRRLYNEYTRHLLSSSRSIPQFTSPNMVSTADLERLHRLIVENPVELDSRLIYADALQELGDPRGEFIAAANQG